jgi:alkanesulfonate monooxygenase SsuD/methylene tetrahydromethanopterin reductase-like flavin-dependent oxidoreductase (luciferase family)
MLRSMPTPESAAAFAKLVQTRARLNIVSSELKEALNARGLSALDDERYRKLQQEWDEALRAFEVATDEFSSVVHHLRDDIEAQDH